MNWYIARGIALATLVASAGVLACGVQTPTSKKGYIVVQAEVSNPEQYAKYSQLSPGIIARHGGRFLARGGRTETLEGPAGRSRVVIIEFPSVEHALAFYRSQEYQDARKLRKGAGDAQFVLVEGQ